MKKLAKYLIFGLVLMLICLPRLHAQSAATSAPAGHAPDELMKTLSDLVHTGKYAEAQQLTTGLLLAYPDDQRLIKAKSLMDKSLASSKSADAASSASAAQLTGMDKVDYNALIELARQAQQTTDLEQQNASLNQFMDQSSLFLQKHPNEILLWQLRAASAISLNDPMAGYEAGQKLLTMGAADRNDVSLQRLLAQLKNKGWLGEEWAEKTKKQVEFTKKYDWMQGTWSETFTSNWRRDSGINRGLWGGEKWFGGSAKYEHNEEFYLSKSSAVIEAYEVNAGVKSAEPSYSGTMLDSGEMRWEGHIGGFSGWEKATSCEIDEHKRTVTMVFLSWNDQNASQPETHLFTKTDGSTH